MRSHPRGLVVLVAGPDGAGDSARPHARTPHGTLVSLGLLGYYWLDFFLGGWLRQRAIRRRGGLVVVERGWWDVGIDSRRYRLSVPPAVVRTLGSLLPRPDLALVLHGDPRAVAVRKGELATAEIARQNALWRTARAGHRQVFLDADEPEETVLGRAVAAGG